MNETWSASRTAINRLKVALRDADDETRWDIGFWATGLVMMSAAIVFQFGWAGLLFCFGAITWKAGDHALRNTP